ncbi:IS66 family transposase [Singulisphaera acidiphila]|uniref:Transposase n=2 Tax=Singulisphaera acidiphila TaxID=466153 RepID=L0DM66_SINAD|nr:IS66 family transposase [Singulisphaera acidiphila]AGA30352.1 transposase [Singulisphaera acidiphila DSM 18658]
MINPLGRNAQSGPESPASPPVSGDAAPPVDAMQQRIQDLLAALDQATRANEELTQENDRLRQELERYRRYVYGRRSERCDDPGQGHLFAFGEDLEVTPEAEPEAPTPAAPRKSRPSRTLDFSRLPHVRIEHDVPEADKTCSCCGRSKARIGEDERRELEFIPARLEVRVHVLPKYACSHCHDGVKSPNGPERPLPGCIAGAGLLSQLLISKFIDHLTLYRFEDISVRYGLHLPRATLCDWVRKAAELMGPLYDLQKQLVLQSPVIWTDDTPVKALGGEAPGSLTTRFWLYHGDEDHSYDVYDHTASRKRDGPATFLAGFVGYLQADAYAGYDGLYLGSPSAIHEVACWAHARRKFYDARSSSPGNAGLILEAIRRLYDVEDRVRGLSVEARQALRAQEAVPILERLRGDLDRLADQSLPKSALGQALTYARNQWKALCRYTEDGRLTIDNNVAERRLRDQAIGRKNWLFLGNVDAGPRAAVLSTIVAGAKRHRLEPWAYVKDVLMTLSVAPERVEDLLPDRWARNHPGHVLTHRLEESRERARRRDAKRTDRRKRK